MTKVNDYSPSEQSYKDFLKQTKEFVRVAPVDQERTMCLVGEAIDTGSFQSFAAASGTSKVAIARIMNGVTVTVKNNLMAGISAAAESGGIIDLDMFMEAQGRVRKGKIGEFRKKQNRIARQLIIDNLLSSGCCIEYCHPGSNSGDDGIVQSEKCGSEFTLKVNYPDNRSSDSLLWNIRTYLPTMNESCPGPGAAFQQWSRMVISLISERLIKASEMTGNFSPRQDTEPDEFEKKPITKRYSPLKYSLIIDDEKFFYEGMDWMLSEISSGVEISVILISLSRRKVIDEKIFNSERIVWTPKSGRVLIKPESILLQPGKMFPYPERKNPRERYSRDLPETIIPELRQGDCRRIICDNLLKQNLHVQYEGKAPIVNSIVEIDPDVILDVRESGKEAVHWAICDKLVYEKSGKQKTADDVHGWLLKVMAYYFQNGYMNRFILVLNNQEIYNNAVDMLKSVTVSREISIILISVEDNLIRDEFFIPQKYPRTDLIRLK